jgi:hypothetical protein
MNSWDGWAFLPPDEPTPLLDELCGLDVLRDGLYSDGRRFYEVIPRAEWPSDGRAAEREEARALLELGLACRGSIGERMS